MPEIIGGSEGEVGENGETGSGQRRTRREHRAARVGVVLAALVLSAPAVEFALAWLPPALRGDRIAHPANVREARRSVEFAYEFRTNRYGLRERAIPRRPAPGVRRILVVGDSFVEGWGVAEEDRFSNRLETLLRARGRPVEVINAGLAGAGPPQYLRVIEEIGLGLRPDEVLVCVYANDVANTPDRAPVRGAVERLLPRTCNLLRAAVTRVRALRTRDCTFEEKVIREAARRGIPEARIRRWRAQLPRDLVEAVDRGEFNGRLLSYGLLYPAYWTDSIDMDSLRGQRQWRVARDLLDECVSRCREHGVVVRIAFLPSPFQDDPEFHEPDHPSIVAGTIVRREWLEGETEIQKRLREWAAERGVPFLDLTMVFRNASRAGVRVHWPLDGHWNAAGHSVAATALADWLASGDPP